MEDSSTPPLPLYKYLRPTVEPTPGSPSLDESSRLERKTFFDVVLDDRHLLLAKAFVDGGFSINRQRAGDGATPLHIAIARRASLLSEWLPSSSFSAAFSPASSLSDRNSANCDKCDSPRGLPMDIPNLGMLIFLIHNGAELNARTGGGVTPLMVGAAAGNGPGVRWLLENGADSDMRDGAGSSSLRYAIGDPAIMEIFREYLGEDVLRARVQGERLLHVVCTTPGWRFPMLYLLEELHLSLSSESNVVEKENERGIEGEKERTCRGGNDPFDLAVRSGDVAMVRELLAKDPEEPARWMATIPPRVYSPFSPIQMLNKTPRLRRAMLERWDGVKYWWDYWRLRWWERSEGEVNHHGVQRLLHVYAATPSQSRRKTLLEEGKSWIGNHGSNLRDGLLLFLLPHAFLYLWCYVIEWLAAMPLAVWIVLMWFLRIKKADEEGVKMGHFSCRSVFFVIGFIIAQVANLLYFTVFCYYDAHDINQYYQSLFYWLIPSAVVMVLSLLTMFIKSPGVVSSTLGQRKGIYSMLRKVAKGEIPSKDFIHTIALQGMAKKPLRAQWCPHLRRVVLRYDHYCAYLGNSIGARNHKYFLLFHFAYLSLLGSFYYYALFYQKVCFIASYLLKKLSDRHKEKPGEFEIARFAGNLCVSSPIDRFGYLYTQLVLPLMMLLVAYTLIDQLLHISRALTLFDIQHVEDESRVYCLRIGNDIHSLFDTGSRFRNIINFFTKPLDEIVYLAPQMNAYLKKKVLMHQRWNRESCSCSGKCHSENNIAIQPSINDKIISEEGERK
ncbi:unnamed protein product [Phytomonas sp. Hart1]|nr:unnamed protein product [Phytomonas sp. Hart1]|eukprot:CCW67567.1 unnamed protein product [Phytomonas sp. isolate Hart1]